MQVATLFRETATLLGASMEAGGALQDGALPLGLSMGVPASSGSVESHMHQGYKVTQSAIKPEPLDDGYETSADVLLPHTLPLKCKQEPSDPYSFVDEDLHYDHHNPHDHLGHEHPATQTPHMNPLAGLPVMPGPKKRGRKKKIKNEGGEMIDGIMNAPVATVVKERKKHDRFNGMPEEEVSKRTLPDHLTQNLDIIIIGINPGLFAAFKGHHYAGPGNHFWKCLYLSGLTPEQMTADEDYKLLHVGIGFTNMVQRATKGSADLTRKEIKEGSQILLEKLQHFKPKIAVFNGKLIFEVFSGKKDFSFGRQPDLVDGTNTYMWVMPSSSARCAQLPRAADKVPFYSALKKFRDFLNGMVASLDDSEVVFSDNKLKTCYENEHKSDSNLLYPEYNSDLIDISNAVMKKEDDVPGKKKRGRPKKIKVEGELHKPPTPRKSSVPTNGDDVPKKKRGRPKKVKPDDNSMRLEHTNPNILKCFSSPSPLHSPVYCHMNNQGTPPTPGTPVGYPGLTNLGISHQPYAQSPQQPYAHSPQQTYVQSPQQTYAQSPQQTYVQSPQQSYAQSPQQTYAQSPQQPYAQSPQQPYAQSPQPQSQPFTHSDLSSEISAAISSEHLGSPTSPSLGPPDFDPPSSMPTEDTTECRFSSPAPSSASEHPPVQPLSHHAYSTYRGFTAEESYSQSSVTGSNSTPEYRVQDVSSKSLSGLESLVDQIPSIADGENGAHNSAANTVENTDQYGGNSGPGINAYHGYSTSPGPAPSVPHYPAASYGVSSNGGGYGGLAVSSLNYNPSYPTSGPGIYMDHHPMAVPHALYHPYSQQYGGYGPMSPAPPPALHVPSPNYPYYNSGYGHMPHHTQSGSIPSPIASAPAYLPNHMFDRIKPDIGYGGF